MLLSADASRSIATTPSPSYDDAENARRPTAVAEMHGQQMIRSRFSGRAATRQQAGRTILSPVTVENARQQGAAPGLVPHAAPITHHVLKAHISFASLSSRSTARK